MPRRTRPKETRNETKETGKRAEENKSGVRKKGRSGLKGTKMRNKGNEEADRRERERRLLETKKRTDGNKKADRCGLGSGPLKTGGGIGDEG